MTYSLNEAQFNILIASILADGELTKLYPGTRRKNNSYREHYGEKQKEYRMWKESLMNGLFYITPKSHTLRTPSLPLFTELYRSLYNKQGHKTISPQILSKCTHPYFLAILYMDDGSLSISHRINQKQQKIYITPNIYLYLQNFKKSELIILKQHIENVFHIHLQLANRNDGHGFILRTTSVKEAFKYLKLIKGITHSCPSMYYKTNWNYRLKLEREKWVKNKPDHQLVVSSSDRFKNYSVEEIEQIIFLKKRGETDRHIANVLGRSYWSIVYKLRELREQRKI